MVLNTSIESQVSDQLYHSAGTTDQADGSLATTEVKTETAG